MSVFLWASFGSFAKTLDKCSVFLFFFWFVCKNFRSNMSIYFKRVFFRQVVLSLLHCECFRIVSVSHWFRIRFRIQSIFAHFIAHKHQYTFGASANAELGHTHTHTHVHIYTFTTWFSWQKEHRTKIKLCSEIESNICSSCRINIVQVIFFLFIFFFHLNIKIE